MSQIEVCYTSLPRIPPFRIDVNPTRNDTASGGHRPGEKPGPIILTGSQTNNSCDVAAFHKKSIPGHPIVFFMPEDGSINEQDGAIRDGPENGVLFRNGPSVGFWPRLAKTALEQ
ncbi:predicted protein [Histoplasma capsulatum G186AR]|uniref:Uncharacterized protein n=1 Tax=Ajellomyces capsulatus (strain G186AR / H82 / ATCC MYA-2454 / RMSCC 2432) TaxID=447093 RepID=C0NWS0_AJECG|nr:uncharacterized protein HCBG_07600 [Histoplasma capsulatum G186AR]EEH04375.1 predicted protein [Histoplasma capsulatum G186AR]